MSRDAYLALKDKLNEGLADLQTNRKDQIVSVTEIKFRKIVDDWANEWDQKQDE